MEKYIYISFNKAANLDLSIQDDLKAFIEKYRANIDFIEYHHNDDEEQNYIDYLE